MERELEALEGVDWATVNQALGRVIVAFDGEQTGIEDIVDVVETVEQARGVSHEEFPAERPDHPGDDAPVRHEAWALAMDLAGAGVGSLARSFRTNVLSAEVAALVGLVEATPALRRPLEARLGPAADLGLAAVHSFAQSFAGTPLSLLVDAAHRTLLLRELSSRRAVWELREPSLCDATTAGAPAVEAPPSSRPFPPGPGRAVRAAVERRGLCGRRGRPRCDPRPTAGRRRHRRGQPQGGPPGCRRLRSDPRSPARAAGCGPDGPGGAAAAGPGRHGGAGLRRADDRRLEARVDVGAARRHG